MIPWRHGLWTSPYSNGMGPDMSVAAREAGKTGLPLMEGARAIETSPAQRYLTQRYTERAVDLIGRNKARPFFLYLAHNMPHTPLFVSDRFKGTTEGGLYA